jgi:hypothetical protein
MRQACKQRKYGPRLRLPQNRSHNSKNHTQAAPRLYIPNNHIPSHQEFPNHSPSPASVLMNVKLLQSPRLVCVNECLNSFFFSIQALGPSSCPRVARSYSSSLRLVSTYLLPRRGSDQPASTVRTFFLLQVSSKSPTAKLLVRPNFLASKTLHGTVPVPVSYQ